MAIKLKSIVWPNEVSGWSFLEDTELWVDVEPREVITAVGYGPFDQAINALHSNEYRVISLAKNAELRMQEGLDSDISETINFTREGLVGIPDKGLYLVRDSPVLYSPEEATSADREGMVFYPSSGQIERVLEDSIKVPYERLDSMGDIEIPVDRFGEDELMVWIFGGESGARRYGEFLNSKNSKIRVDLYPEDYTRQQERPFATQSSFGPANFHPLLNFDGSGLSDYRHGVRGISEKLTRPGFLFPPDKFCLDTKLKGDSQRAHF